MRGARAYLFFGPDREALQEQVRREARAKAISASCPVRAECLNDALACHVRHGIWGGLNDEERFRERLSRARAPASCRDDALAGGTLAVLTRYRGLERL